jgi:hypothetical protein
MFWQKLALISKYKYVMSFENAEMDNWCGMFTERMNARSYWCPMCTKFR